jgi:hypothetical protein
LLEEGLVQRAVNIFAWGRDGVDRAATIEYLAALPISDLVLFVEVTESTSFERATSRGLPARLVGHEEDTVQRFMKNAADIAGITEAHLEQVDRASFVIENGGPLDRALASLEAVVESHLEAETLA